MNKYFLSFLLLSASQVFAQQKISPQSAESVHLFVDPITNSDDPEVRMAYGLNVIPPWPDGGSIFINLPEHLWYMPDTKGIARHHDKRNNVWHVSNDGTRAGYNFKSILEPGVHLSVKVRAKKDRVNFEMTIKNNSTVLLKSIGALLCFQYKHLKGFSAALTDNFAHTFIVMDGEPVALKDINVKNNDALARMAQVKDCKDESNWWAITMGGMIDQRVDVALIALTSLTDNRKVMVTWFPGKSILSNSFIPCIHGDPCIGDLAPGESSTVKGMLIFTYDSIESVINELTE